MLVSQAKGGPLVTPENLSPVFSGRRTTSRKGSLPQKKNMCELSLAVFLLHINVAVEELVSSFCFKDLFFRKFNHVWSRNNLLIFFFHSTVIQICPHGDYWCSKTGILKPQGVVSGTNDKYQFPPYCQTWQLRTNTSTCCSNTLILYICSVYSIHLFHLLSLLPCLLFGI